MKLKDNLIGIYEKAIPNQFEWEQKIAIAKEAGFDFIEMSVDESDERLSRLDWTKTQREELISLLDKYKMRILSMCLSGHRRFPFGSSDESKRKKAYEIIDKAIDLAVDMGIQNIQLAGYDVYYEDSTDQSVKLFEEGLKYSAAQAEQKGVMLTIEIMDTYFLGTISRALPYIHKVNSKALHLYPDLGNLTQWSDNPSEELKLGFDYIEAIHLKDTKPGVFKCVPFGEGTVKFEELFKTLKTLNYQKPFLIEMWADNDIVNTVEQTIQQLIEAKDWLQKRM